MCTNRWSRRVPGERSEGFPGWGRRGSGRFTHSPDARPAQRSALSAPVRFKAKSAAWAFSKSWASACGQCDSTENFSRWGSPNIPEVIHVRPDSGSKVVHRTTAGEPVDFLEVCPIPGGRISHRGCLGREEENPQPLQRFQVFTARRRSVASPVASAFISRKSSVKFEAISASMKSVSAAFRGASVSIQTRSRPARFYGTTFFPASGSTQRAVHATRLNERLTGLRSHCSKSRAAAQDVALAAASGKVLPGANLGIKKRIRHASGSDLKVPETRSRGLI